MPGRDEAKDLAAQIAYTVFPDDLDWRGRDQLAELLIAFAAEITSNRYAMSDPEL